MAFPFVESTTPSTQILGDTVHPVAMPTLVNAGDLLLIFFSPYNADVPTPPTAWGQLQNVEDSGFARLILYAKVSLGNEGGTTVDIITDSSTVSSANCLRISGQEDIEIGTAANGYLSTPDPPAVTATWGSAENLFIAALAHAHHNRTLTGYPTNYDDNQVSTSSGISGIGNNADMVTCTRNLEAATDDPDAFTLTSGSRSVACAYIVQPAAAPVGGAFSVIRRQYQHHLG